MVTGGAEEGFFEEDESPEAVARLAAMFVNPPRFVRDEAHLVAVVQTLRRQSERKVRESIVADLEERLGQLRRSAIRLEAGKWTTMTPCGVRGRLEEAVYCLWIARGFPGYGISYGAWEMPYPLRGHQVSIRGYPVRDPVGYTVACSCSRNLLAEGMAEDEWGWSPTVMGAKRLARRHAGLM